MPKGFQLYLEGLRNLRPRESLAIVSVVQSDKELLRGLCYDEHWERPNRMEEDIPSTAIGCPARSVVRRLAPPMLLFSCLAAVPPADAQDLAPPPGFFGWTLVNECSAPIRVALHYAPDGELVTKGWWSLEPGSELVSHSATQFVAYIADSPEMRVRAPDLEGAYELAVDPAGDFVFAGLTPPDELEPAMFHAVELTDWSVTLVECEGEAEPASESDGGAASGARAEPASQADAKSQADAEPGARD